MTIRDGAGALHGNDGKYTLDPKARGNAAALGADTQADERDLPVDVDDGGRTDLYFTDEDDEMVHIGVAREGETSMSPHSLRSGISQILTASRSLASRGTGTGMVTRPKRS